MKRTYELTSKQIAIIDTALLDYADKMRALATDSYEQEDKSNYENAVKAIVATRTEILK